MTPRIFNFSLIRFQKVMFITHIEVFSWYIKYAYQSLDSKKCRLTFSDENKHRRKSTTIKIIITYIQLLALTEYFHQGNIPLLGMQNVVS